MAGPPILKGDYKKGVWVWDKEAAVVVGAFVSVLEQGAYKREAARHAGISERTVSLWTEQGAEERRRIARGNKPRKRASAYLEFLLATEKAMAAAQLSDLQVITRAAQDGAWQAAAWKLERRNPSQWGRQRIEAEVKGGLVVEGIDWLDDKLKAAKGYEGGDT
jgi:hypothetical protein